jgi:hypothetical protein
MAVFQPNSGPAEAGRWPLVLALILPIFALAPLFYPGYFQSHSGLVPLWNVADLRANFAQPGWLPQIGAIFDPWRSSGLLPYYLAAALPFSGEVAVKVVLGGGWLMGSLGMVLWLRSWLGPAGALLAAVVYSYLPHHIATVYVRGAWGEALFWGVLPWAILAATYLVTATKFYLLPGAALFWFLLGLCQLGLTLWAFIFVVALLLVVHRPQALRPALAAGAGLLGAMLLTFWLAAPAPPALLPQFFDHFLYPFQLFSAAWGFGPSRPGWADGLSLQVGFAALGLGFLPIVLGRRAGGRAERRLWFFLGSAVVLLLLQLGIAGPVWRLPLGPGRILAGTLTYPWQLMGFSGLALAVLAGAGPWLEPQLRSIPLFAGLVLLVILSSFSYLSPQFLRLPPDQTGPQALLGPAQLALLDHEFVVITQGDTAGLERGETTMPLALHGPLQPDDTLLLKVVWQPLQPFGQNLKIFAHLVDANNNILAQFDGQPQAGDYPTGQWVPGEMIEDAYPILFPEQAPAPPYRLFLGLYDEAGLSRLPVTTDPEGRIILTVE